jgi:hypothetical protein
MCLHVQALELGKVGCLLERCNLVHLNSIPLPAKHTPQTPVSPGQLSPEQPPAHCARAPGETTG